MRRRYPHRPLERERSCSAVRDAVHIGSKRPTARPFPTPNEITLSPAQSNLRRVFLCGPLAAREPFTGATAYINAESQHLLLGTARLAQRFHLDVTDGQTTIRDEVGVLAPNLNEAIRQAEEVLGEMHRNNEFSSGDEAWKLIIRDVAGDILVTLPAVPRDPVTALAS